MNLLISLLFTFIFSLACANEGTVILPLRAIPENLKVNRLIQVDQVRVARLLSSSLFQIGKNLQLEGKLAKSSYWDKQRKKLHIQLGSATFSDGFQLDADSVISSLSRCIKFGSKNTTSAFTKIKGYQDFISGKSHTLRGLLKEGKNKIAIQTTLFAPLMKENLSSVACSITKPLKKDSHDLLDGAIGVGPYTIANKSKIAIVLKKRFGQGPKNVKFVPTNHYGNFDKLKDNANLILVNSKIENQRGFNSHKNSRLAYWQLSFNNESKPFSNIELRRAISLGLNHKQLALDMEWEKTNLQKGLFPLGMRGFQARNASERNLEKANKILTKSGYSPQKPLKFSLLLSKKKGSEKFLSTWKIAFQGLFVEPSIELIDHKELIKRRGKGEFDLLFHGKDAGSHDPHILLASYLSNSHFNTPRIKNKKCDELIILSLETYEKSERWSYYQKTEQCLLSTYFIIPLATLNSGYALVKKPWKISQKNQYRLNPYDVSNWVKE